MTVVLARLAAVYPAKIAATSGSLMPSATSSPPVSRMAAGMCAKRSSSEFIPKKANIAETSSMVWGR
jgi:hypothetical protein